MKQLIALAGLVLAAPPALAAGGAWPTVKDFSLPDVKGHKHTAAEWKGKRAVVLIFLGTECPVSNGYAPEYARLAKAFGGRGVAFYGVHPDPDVKPADAARHAAEYRLTFPVLMDPRQTLTRRAGVKVTPEAVVLTAEGRLLYRGRIDDRYSADGRRREEPTSRDLEKALSAVLRGEEPPARETKPFGCPLPEPAK